MPAEKVNSFTSTNREGKYMTRILVNPERLRALSTELKALSQQMGGLAESVKRAGGNLDWEVRQKTNVDANVASALTQARHLIEQANQMADYAGKKAQEFSAADQKSGRTLGELIPDLRVLPWYPPIRRLLPWLGPIVLLPILRPWPFPWLPPFKPPVIKRPPALPRPIPQPTPVPGPRPVPTKPPQIPPVDQPIAINDGLFPPKAPFNKWYQSGGGWPTYGDGTLHNGIDIKPQPYQPGVNDQVHPIGPGVIVAAGQETGKDKDGKIYLKGYGNYVVVKHTLPDGSNIYTRYAHLAEKPNFVVNDKVGEDTEIGTMGSTGNSTGPHLHFSVQKEYPVSEGFWNHKPGDLVNPKDPNSQTWGQVMENNFMNPTSFLNGTSNTQFIDSRTTQQAG